MHSYFDLGSYSRPISTCSPDAQLWFDRGLNWSYAFQREEVVRCFEQVVALDPDCAMGYWGIAYATDTGGKITTSLLRICDAVWRYTMP